MDSQNFISDTLTRVSTESFNSDSDSIIALLVFALGELVIEVSRGNPIEIHMGRLSSIRGGTSLRLQSLALFNKARKQIRFVITVCDLENFQTFSLATLYYESFSRHLEFWRLTECASLACQVLITHNSPRGDLIKRVYWHCAIVKTGLWRLHLLCTTGIRLAEGTPQRIISRGLRNARRPIISLNLKCN